MQINSDIDFTKLKCGIFSWYDNKNGIFKKYNDRQLFVYNISLCGNICKVLTAAPYLYEVDKDRLYKNEKIYIPTYLYNDMWKSKVKVLMYKIKHNNNITLSIMRNVFNHMQIIANISSCIQPLANIAKIDANTDKYKYCILLNVCGNFVRIYTRIIDLYEESDRRSWRMRQVRCCMWLKECNKLKKQISTQLRSHALIDCIKFLDEWKYMFTYAE